MKKPLDNKEVYTFLSHLFWKYRDSKISCGDWAENALIALYREGCLAKHLAPIKGNLGGDLWERDD